MARRPARACPGLLVTRTTGDEMTEMTQEGGPRSEPVFWLSAGAADNGEARTEGCEANEADEANGEPVRLPGRLSTGVGW